MRKNQNWGTWKKLPVLFKNVDVINCPRWKKNKETQKVIAKYGSRLHPSSAQSVAVMIDSTEKINKTLTCIAY